MGLILNGGSPSKMLYNGAEVSLYFNGSKIWPESSPTPSFDEVTIGTQTWMAKNLAINDGGAGIYTETVNYGQGDVVEYYYTWDAANKIASTITGWHLPSVSEFETLFSFVGSNSDKLKSTYGWTMRQGSDNFGFAAFPAGRIQQGSLTNKGNAVYFWTNTEYSEDSVYCKYFSYSTTTMQSFYDSKSYFGFSVRLIKDS